jgi:hypothetical protein
VAQSTATGISLLNSVIVGVLVSLSSFQRFLNKTEEKASSIVKMFLVQFINTGVVILLVNAQISELSLPEQFPVFAGRFSDFTVEWYKNVGATISLTMFINIFTPHIGGIIGLIKAKIFQCLDRKCKRD